MLYDINKIDYDSDLEMVTLDTTKSSSSWIGSLSGQPEKYVFYLNNSVYQDGVSSAVTIYSGGDWVPFSSISLSDQSHFVYNNSTYDLVGAQVKIGDTQFEIIDSAWRVSSQIMEVYLQAA